ncbi:sodium- and chloride-dependent glycine transporter 2-like [Octopus sinensis]|uniref:Sodium- and chloride-dependent glycine transporter 2-like n=1 Tax=Octopus sinensis TaxID=2607531 RepID=A0A7E6EKC2_9MOLL|nr:sodium- and chloride-dependent glycine transporter 2-like [Octopus sinensis]
MSEKLKWSNSIEFILTLLSFAIGLGNIWRFPYLCFKYGGGIGYSCVFISMFIGIYYNILVSIFLQYFYKIIQTTGNIGDMGSINSGLAWTYAIAWIMVFLSLSRSVKTVGKVVYFTAILPYIILTILLIRGVTLKGSKAGIQFYIQPDISKISSLVWKEASTQIFYSLSTCSGGIITLSSFNKYKNNFLFDVLFVSFANSFTSFYSGFAIFSATGHLAYLSNKTIPEVTKHGSELVFISYPASISALPGAQFWATLFYLMMFCLGFGTMHRGIYYALSKHDSKLRQKILGFEKFATEIELMVGKRPGIIWKTTFLVLTPVSCLKFNPRLTSQILSLIKERDALKKNKSNDSYHTIRSLNIKISELIRTNNGLSGVVSLDDYVTEIPAPPSGKR